MGLGGAISDLISQAVGKTAQEDAATGGSSPSNSMSDQSLARRNRIVKSGAGLAIACVVITVFILAASFLKAVLFGLILAYFLLPLEKGFERLLTKPWLSTLLSTKPKSPEDEAQVNESLAFKASLLTFASLGIGFLLALALIVSIALPMISGTGARIKNWAASNDTFKRMESQVKSNLGIGPVPEGEAQIPQGRLENIASWATIQIEGLLSDRESKQKLTSIAIDNGHGLVSGATTGVKFIGNFFFDFLLTFFFLFYFLQKMAAFERTSGVGDGKISPGAWIVKGIFDTSWMPETSSESRSEAASVIDRICQMLRAWVRGYLSIIIVDSILYISAFLLFGVPYAPVLGMIAGCTILLPFIGPVASGALTICVCLGVGDGVSLFTIIGVLLTYIFIHGVVEHLFLYPKLVGKSLGLTSLETIIVVLLGGLFGGIAGMIFAVPAASVLKYLIPTVYHCWFTSQPKNRSLI